MTDLPHGHGSLGVFIRFYVGTTSRFEGIRSEPQLLRVAADRLSLQWYLEYDLAETLPDHSSLTKIRQRQDL